MMNESILFVVVHGQLEGPSTVVFHKVLVFHPMLVGFCCSSPYFKGSLFCHPDCVVRGWRMASMYQAFKFGWASTSTGMGTARR